MSFGATLRLLRLQSGLGLRDLARRVGVSSTYLSRVETGVDPAPTPARLVNIARELGVPPQTLLEIAHRVGPLLTEYVERVPEAGSFFVDLALRGLSPAQLLEVQTFVRTRFPQPARELAAPSRSIVELLSEDRLVLELRCASVVDALQIAAGRLASAVGDASSVAAALLARDADACAGIGGGVAVASVSLAGAEEAAAVVTLAAPLAHPTPDGQPLRVIVVLVGTRGHSCLSRYIAEVVCLTDRGLVEALCGVHSPSQVLESLDALTSRTR